MGEDLSTLHKVLTSRMQKGTEEFTCSVAPFYPHYLRNYSRHGNIITPNSKHLVVASCTKLIMKA